MSYWPAVCTLADISLALPDWHGCASCPGMGRLVLGRSLIEQVGEEGCSAVPRGSSRPRSVYRRGWLLCLFSSSQWPASPLQSWSGGLGQGWVEGLELAGVGTLHCRCQRTTLTIDEGWMAGLEGLGCQLPWLAWHGRLSWVERLVGLGKAVRWYLPLWLVQLVIQVLVRATLRSGHCPFSRRLQRLVSLPVDIESRGSSRFVRWLFLSNRLLHFFLPPPGLLVDIFSAWLGLPQSYCTCLMDLGHGLIPHGFQRLFRVHCELGQHSCQVAPLPLHFPPLNLLRSGHWLPCLTKWVGSYVHYHQLQVSLPDHPVVDLGGMAAAGVGGQVSVPLLEVSVGHGQVVGLCAVEYATSMIVLYTEPMSSMADWPKSHPSHHQGTRSEVHSRR